MAVPQKVRLIRDIVFGYIELQPQDMAIIDTPFFQRLKRIRQLTAFALYPSANQTRFEHSLGVMYLGSRVFENLVAQGDIAPIEAATGLTQEALASTVRVACLLHDVGHAALSHVGETFYDKSAILTELKALDSAIYDAVGADSPKGSKHELMSCLVVVKHFKASLPASADLELLCRMITRSEYPDTSDRVTLNPVLSILNSPYDVDRLDYILRDSLTTGTFGVSIDYERIIRGYAVRDNTLLFLRKAIPSVVNLITGRDFLYQWLYNHHTVAYTDLLVEEILKDWFSREPTGKRDLFSLTAIENEIDDSDVWVRLKERWKAGNPLATRLLERRFHKTLWKTPYDFDVCAAIPEPRKDKLMLKTKGQGRPIDEKETLQFRESLCTHLGVPLDCLLLATRPVKHFDPMTNRSVYFWVENGAQPYARIGGQSAFAVGKTEFPLVFYDAAKITREAVFQALKT